jgi:hypothetical protein
MRNEDFEGERNIAFKRGQNQTCLNYAERSNAKELNDKRALLDGIDYFLLLFDIASRFCVSAIIFFIL